MIYVETEGKIVRVRCGDNTGQELLDEVSFAVVSVVMAVASEAKNEDLSAICARDYFKEVILKSAEIFEKKHGLDILAGDDEVDDYD